jgi:hypothetical protein
MLSSSRNFEAAARADLANDNLRLNLAHGAPKEWRVALRSTRPPNRPEFGGLDANIQ